MPNLRSAPAAEILTPASFTSILPSRPRPLLLSLLFILLGSLALVRPVAAADDTAVAREHAQKGKAFMDLGKYPEAASEYEVAYAARPDPALLLNLAQAYRLAGNTSKALFFYRKYLQHVPTTPYRADIEDKIAALEAQSKAGGSGATPAPATDPNAPQGSPYAAGNGAGNLPPPPPPPGGAYVAGASPGPPGAGSGYTGPNALAPPAGPAGAANPPPSLSSSLSSSSTASSIASTPAADHGQKLKLAALVTGGVGVLSIVVGAVYGAQAKDSAKKIEDAAANNQVYTAALQTEDSHGRSAQAKEAAFLVIGVAALAAGGFLYYYSTRKPATEAAGPIAILPAASPSQLGAAVTVAF